MKICFISPGFGAISGGSEMIIHNFSEHLSKKHEVTVLTGRSMYKPLRKELLNVPYDILTVPYWPRFTPPNTLACKFVRSLYSCKAESYSLYYNILLRPKITRKIKDMDIISTHYWVDSRLFSNLAFKLGVPSIFHILGGPYTKEFFEVDKSILYIAVSRWTQSLINNAHKINIENVVTPGIPSYLFSGVEEKKCQKEDKTLSLLFVGRLQPSKGLFELIELFRRLVKKHPNLRLTIVGEGDISGSLEKLIRKFQLQNKVLLTGPLPYGDVFKYYRSSTLFVFPSKNEVFPLVLLEAMACGLPVIASDIPGNRESTGENAILIPSEDLDSWVEEVGRVLSDRDFRAELSKRGIEWARQFTWEKKVAEYERELLKAKEMFIKSRDRL